MIRNIRLLTVMSLIAALALGLAACGSDDDDDSSGAGATSAMTETDDSAMAATLMLNGEETVLALDADTAGVLEENQVTVAPVAPATAGDAGIAFPITGGEVDSESLAGTIDHSGGLKFSAGGTEVELTDFVIDTEAGTLTATLPDGTQLTTLDVDLSGLERSDEGGAIVLTGIATTLTGDAATALNDAFSVELFEGGLPIGEVTVRATAG